MGHPTPEHLLEAHFVLARLQDEVDSVADVLEPRELNFLLDRVEAHVRAELSRRLQKRVLDEGVERPQNVVYVLFEQLRRLYELQPLKSLALERAHRSFNILGQSEVHNLWHRQLLALVQHAVIIYVYDAPSGLIYQYVVAVPVPEADNLPEAGPNSRGFCVVFNRLLPPGDVQLGVLKLLLKNWRYALYVVPDVCRVPLFVVQPLLAHNLAEAPLNIPAFPLIVHNPLYSRCVLDPLN